MSLAKVVHVVRARKDQKPCERCSAALPAGSPYKHYSVGFRGSKRTRCTTCPDPLLSERESSKVSTVYAAQEALDVDSIETVEDAREVLSEFADAVREVAQEYTEAAEAAPGLGEASEEAADVLNTSADEVENLDLSEFEAEDNADEVTCEDCSGTGEVDDPDTEAPDAPKVSCEACAGSGTVEAEEGAALDLDALRAAVHAAVNEAELP